MSDHVTLFEVGPRDGLQNEAKQISTADKVKLIDLLSQCGFTKIEVTSFTSPKWVPQMADASEVLASINRNPKISYAALTPNLKGFERALAAKADEIAIFASASEGFSQKNINCSIAESLTRFEPVAAAAKATNIPVRAYVSCVTDCPFDGPTPPQQVAKVAAQLLALGCYEVSLGDTIGAATPKSTTAMLDAVLDVIMPEKLAGHFHDTHGNALANIQTCLKRGLRTFDASVAGLGGCPYAPGAKGNVDTGSVIALVEQDGFHTGIDAHQLQEVARFAKTLRSDT